MIKSKLVLLVSFAIFLIRCSESDDKSSSEVTLSGYWVSECQEFNTNKYAIESFDIENEQFMTLQRSEYSDSECKDLQQVFEAQLVFVPDTVVKNGDTFDADHIFQYLILTPKTFSAASELNTSAFCELTSWIENQTVDLSLLNCDSTLGFSAPPFSTRLYNRFRISNNQLFIASTPTPFGALTLEERSSDFEGAQAHSIYARPLQLNLSGLWQTSCVVADVGSFFNTWDFRSSSPSLLTSYSLNTSDCSQIDVESEYNFSSYVQTDYVDGYPLAREIEFELLNGFLTPKTLSGATFLNTFETINTGACEHQGYTVDVPFNINDQDCTNIFEFTYSAGQNFYNIVQITNGILNFGVQQTAPFGAALEQNRSTVLGLSDADSYIEVVNPYSLQEL